MKVTLDERSHVYRDGSGRNLLAVTHIIDLNGLIPSQMKDEEASARGRAVHLATALYDRNEVATLRIHLQETAEYGTEGYLDSWIRFLKDTRFKVRLIEHQMMDKTYGIAGTLDREGVLNRADALLDLKSNKAGTIWPTTALQLAAYAHMKARGKRIQRVGVALKPDGTYSCTPYPVEMLASDLADFLALVRALRVKQRLGLVCSDRPGGSK